MNGYQEPLLRRDGKAEGRITIFRRDMCNVALAFMLTLLYSGMRTKYRYRIEETYEFWKIEQFLIRKSTSLPHINGLVVDNSPMRDMDPLASEIQSILVLTHESLLNEEYRHHRVIPVSFHNWPLSLDYVLVS